MGDKIKNIISKIYTIALMCFVLWYGFFITPLMLGHGEGIKELVQLQEIEKATLGTEEEKAFKKMLLEEQTQVKKTDLGARVIEEQYIKGHFHHVGLTVEPDTTSVCIRCHGDVPHDKAKAIRAFLNMHAFYLACETCHVSPPEGEAPWVFRWLDKRNGGSVGNPPGLLATEVDKYGNYGAKVGPGYMEDNKFRFLNTEKERSFVEEYLRSKDILSPTQQSKMKKVIHRMVSEKPLLCDACHTKKEPYLDFALLGYPPHRIDSLTSTEVVGMVGRYKEFYIPKMLLPGVGGNESRGMSN